MSDADTLAVLVFVLCLLGSMFFSGSETAITSFGQRRAEKLREEGGPSGKALRSWVDRPVWTLTTILLGNNVTNTIMGATATALAIRHFSDGPYRDWAVPVAVLVTTTVLLIFGEIVPKAIGRIYTRTVTVPVLRLLNALGQVFYPIVWVLTRITELVIARALDDESAGPAGQVTAGELGYLVKVAEREGTIAPDQAALLRSVFRFDDRIVRDIMVPLDDVTAVDLRWSAEEILEVARSSGHSRLPVYLGDLDDVQGILHIKSMVATDIEDLTVERVKQLMRTPIFVSESLLIADLLRHFKVQRGHLAMVVDDGGDTVGVVTLEDVLEQLVGQIFDETDSAPIALDPTPAGVHMLDGQDTLARVEELLGVDFEEQDGVDSIGDLLTQLGGQMPIAGSVFVVQNVRFKVLAADARRIASVSVELVEAPETAESA